MTPGRFRDETTNKKDQGSDLPTEGPEANNGSAKAQSLPNNDLREAIAKLAEEYDIYSGGVPGTIQWFADDLIALIAQDRQRLLEEYDKGFNQGLRVARTEAKKNKQALLNKLLAEVPEKQWAKAYEENNMAGIPDKVKGFNQALDQCRKIIEAKSEDAIET